MNDTKVKEAVSLAQLRKASQALQRAFPVIRVPKNTVLARGTANVVTAREPIQATIRQRGLTPTSAPTVLRRGEASKDWYHFRSDRGLASQEFKVPAVANAERSAVDQYTRPRPNNIPFNASNPADREAFNRNATLHEYSERRMLVDPRRQALTSRERKRRAFLTHADVNPPLNDLNVAATLTGPGAGAADAIRSLRLPDVAELYSKIPELTRLDLGHQRISRHAIKRISEANARINARTAKRGFTPAVTARVPAASLGSPYAVEKVAAFPGVKAIAGLFGKLNTQAALRPELMYGANNFVAKMLANTAEGASPTVAALGAFADTAVPYLARPAATAAGKAAGKVARSVAQIPSEPLMPHIFPHVPKRNPLSPTVHAYSQA